MAAPTPDRDGSGRHRFARATVQAVFVLLLAGGSVTSTGSGLAVPDWPLSYGQYFPAMQDGVFFEHGHRMLAGLVGLLILALAVWTQRAERRRWLRLLAWSVVAATGLQALLGGLTVLYGLPVSVSAFHACLGQAIFCALCLISEATSPGSAGRPATPAPAAAVVGCVAATAVFGQLAIGAVLRHSGWGLPWHVAGAVVASTSVLALAAAVFTSRREDFLVRPAGLLVGMLAAQLLFGSATAALRLYSPAPAVSKAVLATLHVGLGALVLAVTAVLTARLYGMRNDEGLSGAH